mmetsp:Transcript_5224/g.11342  ORF Transcript_5224/g.11342 Transcript_5224/m.11342 type:complete len:259 (+) Transcript_5224:235-1011(+)|eukprot:CAMPEP_0178486890 /NCGR_PEP_ID=MMETSP0696-20121128/9038_1 /TAXON_ID=265572 /ORGANISM="Extubocellulus spinifer, Strain CCMP396" /LENGTH=258 /DNA_ID=CAMNT_0020114563 /DNA_START=131 /DNA_END=907 /DNA_ORIENTATION=-
MTPSPSQTSGTTTAAALIAAAAGASILTNIALRYIDQRLRWRLKRNRFCRAVTAGQRKSSQLRQMLNGESYNCNERLLAAMRSAAHELAEEYNRPERTAEERDEILRSLLGSCPRSSHKCPTGTAEGSEESYADITIEPPFRVDYGVNIHVGRNFYANFDCTMLDCATITIGDNVFLAPGVQLYTASHPLDAIERRCTEFAKPISIGNDVWVGGCAVILPGVSIGNRVVVAAGAVVTKNVEDDVVVAGVPARVVKNLK